MPALSALYTLDLESTDPLTISTSDANNGGCIFTSAITYDSGLQILPYGPFSLEDADSTLVVTPLPEPIDPSFINTLHDFTYTLTSEGPYVD